MMRKPTLYGFALAMGMLFWLPAAPAQQEALLSNRDLTQTCERTLQLMDSTRVSIPELARAGAPVAENVRQAFSALQGVGLNHSGLTYQFVTNLRAYLALADAVPKPFPFTDEARRQFTELRETADRLESHFRALLERKEADLRNPDRDNLRRYADANQKVPPPQAARPRVVFLGDSITDGWRLNEYFPDHDFINRGIGGQITGQMLGRMQADVIGLRPSFVLVLAGTNDIARGVPLSTIQDNLTMIADLAEANRILPLFASVLPISDYHQERNPQFHRSKQRPPHSIRALNDWIQKLCRERKYVYVDYFTRLVDTAGFLPAELADDGLHPNSAGYRLMAPIALESIETAIKSATPAQKRRRWPF